MAAPHLPTHSPEQRGVNRNRKQKGKTKVLRIDFSSLDLIYRTLLCSAVLHHSFQKPHTWSVCVTGRDRETKTDIERRVRVERKADRERDS